MKHTFFALLASAAVFTACSSTTEPDQTPNPKDPDFSKLPVANRPYDSTRGGIQITDIYYSQDSNKSVIGTADEWIEIETLQPTRTAGWRLNAGDSTQNYTLPDSIHRKLRIYTRTGPSVATGEAMFLQLKVWIWNNSDPDTARLYNDKGELVDTHTYDVK